MTRKFCESDRKVGSGVNGTLETGTNMIGVHPKIIGISSELVLRAIQALVLAKILWREKANGRTRNVMTGDVEMEMLTIFADECPTNDATAAQRGRTVNGLDHGVRVGAVMVDDEVAFVVSDGESTASVEYDVNDVGAGPSRKEGCDKIRIEVRARELGVKGQWKRGVVGDKAECWRMGGGIVTNPREWGGSAAKRSDLTNEKRTVRG
jgi:hypothetical protein